MSYIINYRHSDKVATFADGPYIWINGKKCIDLCLGNGTHILGHNPDLRIWGGSLYGRKCFDDDKYGHILAKYTGFEDFVLCNSGAEATMRAARIARAATGRKQIASFVGHWHGCNDTFLDCDGIPDEIKDLNVRLPNEFESLKKIQDGGFAMVIMEPVQASAPYANKAWLESVRNACDYSGTLLCFDELITGFRLARGGAKEYFGVRPDLATYGKIAGGGLPIGIVAGSKGVMSVCGRVRMGGTFSGNPASLYAGYKVLSRLDGSIYKYLNDEGNRIKSQTMMPVMGVGSINRVMFTDQPVYDRVERDRLEDQEKKKRFYDKCFEKGLHIGENGMVLISMAHKKEIINDVIGHLNSAWCDS